MYRTYLPVMACLALLCMNSSAAPETADKSAGLPGVQDIAQLAPDWSEELVASVEQSYAGWDVEIGDADNDGKNEILTTGCPDSCLHLFKTLGESWTTTLLAKNLAERTPGMGLSVRVADYSAAQQCVAASGIPAVIGPDRLAVPASAATGIMVELIAA